MSDETTKKTQETLADIVFKNSESIRPGAGRILLSDFVYRHKRNMVQDQRVMDFLHDAFCQILSNVPAEKALNLKDSKSGPKESQNWDRDHSIYSLVMVLVQHKIVKTLDAAFDKIEKDGIEYYDFIEREYVLNFISKRIIQKAYEKYSKDLGGVRGLKKRQNPTHPEIIPTNSTIE